MIRSILFPIILALPHAAEATDLEVLDCLPLVMTDARGEARVEINHDKKTLSIDGNPTTIETTNPTEIKFQLSDKAVMVSGTLVRAEYLLTYGVVFKKRDEINKNYVRTLRCKPGMPLQ